MFRRKPKDIIVKLDEVVNNILVEMGQSGPDSPKYSALLTHLERVSTLQQTESKWKLSPDNMLLVAGNLLGILIIVSYEHGHVMTSKGLGFILRSK